MHYFLSEYTDLSDLVSFLYKPKPNVAQTAEHHNVAKQWKQVLPELPRDLVAFQDLRGGDHGVVVHVTDRVGRPTPTLTTTPVYKIRSFKLKFRILEKLKLTIFNSNREL